MPSPLENEATAADFIMDLIGRSVISDTDTEIFIKIMAFLLNKVREKIEKFPDLRDIDSDDNLIDNLWDELAVGLPQNTIIDRTEFLREAKVWYGSKGTDALFRYIGALTDTKVELWHPSRQIMQLSTPNTLLGGTMNKPPSEQSRLGYLRDGIFWAYNVYVTAIKNAEKIKNVDDLISLLRSNHPAGTQRFEHLFYAFSPQKAVPTIDVKSVLRWHDQLTQSSIGQLSVNLLNSGQYGLLDSIKDKPLSISGRSQRVVFTHALIQFSESSGISIGFLTLGQTQNFLNSAFSRGNEPASTLSMFVPISAGPINPSDNTESVTYEEQFAPDNEVVQNHISSYLSLSEVNYSELKRSGVLYKGIDKARYKLTNEQRNFFRIRPRFFGLPMTHERRSEEGTLEYKSTFAHSPGSQLTARLTAIGPLEYESTFAHNPDSQLDAQLLIVETTRYYRSIYNYDPTSQPTAQLTAIGDVDYRSTFAHSPDSQPTAIVNVAPPAAITIDSVPVQVGEVVRMLITVGQSDVWYSRRGTPDIGSISDDSDVILETVGEVDFGINRVWKLRQGIHGTIRFNTYGGAASTYFDTPDGGGVDSSIHIATPAGDVNRVVTDNIYSIGGGFINIIFSEEQYDILDEVSVGELVNLVVAI